LRGRLVDLDSHVMLLPEVTVELLGPELGDPIRRWMDTFVGGLSPADLRVLREEAGLDVWGRKNWLALGAADAAERVQALDRMGVDRQLVFPPITWPALHRPGPEGRAALARYNDFILAWARPARDRLYAVAQLPADAVEPALAEARRVLDSGARAVEWPFATPPAGLSPAAPAWDPFWALLAEAHVPLLLHVGGGGFGDAVRLPRPFMDPAWGDAPALRPDGWADSRSGRADLGTFWPFDNAVVHLPAEVFLDTLVLGRVFERHPGLRVGVIELGARWVSGWVERLTYAASTHRRLGLPPLREPPGESVRRHVRVTPVYREPVDAYIARDGLVEVYAFSTDYPHIEGGKDPVGRFAAALGPLGDQVVERFFVTNGAGLWSA
jgi:predicted TIM-barrel fold metal-dependent hydrolase